MNPEPLPPPTADLTQSVVGVWRLVTREDYDGSGHRVIDPVLGPDPAGILCFSPSRFSAQFMRRDRGAAGAAAPGPTGAAAANNSVASNGYDAYFGSYVVDGRTGLITVHLEGAITPSNIGLSLTREIRAFGDRLWIRLATTTPDGVPITRTLTFERS
jgi:hypothetical protein